MRGVAIPGRFGSSTRCVGVSLRRQSLQVTLIGETNIANRRRKLVLWPDCVSHGNRWHIIPVCMQANRAMQQLLADGKPPKSVDVLPDELNQVLCGGVSIVDDCLVVGKSGVLPRLDSVREAVMDKSGYECFVNHVHLKEHGDSAAVLRQAVTFCRRVSVDALRVAPNRSVRFIISKNDEDWTVHFHTLRRDESWVSDDLEGYAEEAVLVLDSTELGLAV